jgi:SAM-dependent methyltransferase
MGNPPYKRTLRPCPGCCARSGEVLHRQDFYLIEGHPLAKGYDVIACASCGFVYADTKVHQREYDTFYQNMSKYADPLTGTGGGIQSWDFERLQETAATIVEFLHSPQDRILDIGCANGGLLSAIRDLGFCNLLGVDPSSSCVKAVRSKGIVASEGMLGSLKLSPGSFDCILLSHVLEHVQDLDVAMNNVVSLLKPNGVLYVEVPDASRYIDYLYAPFQDFNTEHINHFSQRTMRAFGSRFGLAPANEHAKTIRSSESSLYPALWCVFRPSTQKLPIEPIGDLTEKIKLYINASTKMMFELDQRLERELLDANGIIVWGVGQLAMKLLTLSVLNKTEIVACVDSNPVLHGKNLLGARVVAPEAVKRFSHPIVITSLLHQTDIAGRIRAMGLDNRIVALRDRPDIPFVN